MRATAADQASRGLITHHPKRRDWYVIPAAWLPEISAAPVIQLDPRLGPVVHRSHLAMLAGAHPEVENFLFDLRSRERLFFSRASDCDSAGDLEVSRAKFDEETTAIANWKLRNYQHIGREFIRTRRGTLLADQMRCGKTPQIISSHDEDLGPLFVVAPLATREVWLSWFKRRWPDERPLVLTGRHIEYENPKAAPKRRSQKPYDTLDGNNFDQSKLNSAKLIFANYDILSTWKQLGGRRIGTFVLDEIHIISQRNTKRAQAAMFASVLSERVVGATGTPVWNQPAGLFTTLNCIAPAAFGKFFDFAKRYTDLQPTPHGYTYDGSANEEEFKQRMSELMLRRTWQEVSGELPQIERSVEVVDITEEQQFQIEKEAEAVRDHAKRTTAVGALARFRRLLAKLKINTAVDAAKRVLMGGEKVVVWTWHRDVALKIEEQLANANYPGFVVSGSTNMDLREDLFNRWRVFHEPAPLVITLSVGQVGIDLSAARQTIFAELDFTPSIVAQAEMRTFSPTRPMAATYITIDHEIERKILAALQEKCEVALRLNMPAAESAVGILATAFSRAANGPDDFDALAKAIMMDHPDLSSIDENDDYHGALWDYDFEKGS